jgi:hypothetical protein
MMTSYCLTIAGNICIGPAVDKRLFVPDHMSKCHANRSVPAVPTHAKKA